MKEIIIGLLTAVLTVIGTIAASSLGYFNKDRELDLEMVRISLSILGGENKDTSAQARRFALRALEKYSGVDIPENDFAAWAENGTVPSIPQVLLRQPTALDAYQANKVVRDILCGSIDPAECAERFPPPRN